MRKPFQRKKNYYLTALTLSSTLISSAAVMATELEEIIVTATKRAENIQDVPITITAVSGENLVKQGIEGMDELPLVTPGLYFGRVTGAAVVQIRGIGSNNGTAGNEPSVATYVDGVYNPNAQALLDTFHDLDRIEVLKGPQGTLFGRNANGGLIHIITKDPSQDAEAKVKVGVGNYDTYDVAFYGNAGLSENLAANVSVSYKDQGESYYSNNGPAGDLMGEEDRRIRGKLLYTPSDKTKIMLSANYSDMESSAGMGRTQVPGQLSSAAAGGLGHEGDYWNLTVDHLPYVKIESKGASLHFEHSFDSFDLINIAAWREDEQIQDNDIDGTRTNLQWVNPTLPSEFFSEEIRIQSNTEGRVDWIAGFYYSDWMMAYDPIPFFSGGALLSGHSQQDIEGTAIFGETTWHISDSTSLITGLRWNRDEVDFKGDFSLNGNLIIPERVAPGESFEETTWRIGLNHKIGDDILLYATYSRGYKTGLYSMVPLGAVNLVPSEPEILDAYEIGFKSDGWMDGRLRLNGSLFFYDYQDLQVFVLAASGTGSDTVNAPKAEVTGGELEIVIQATDRLSFNGGLSMLKTEFKEYFGQSNQPPPSGLGLIAVRPVDFSGNDIYRTPETTLTTALNYTWPVANGTANFSVNYYYNSGFYWFEDNISEQDAYHVVNSNLSWTDAEEKYKLSLWGRNLFEEEYAHYVTNSGNSGYAYSAAEPRMFGVSAEYSFY